MSQAHPPSDELFAYRDGELDHDRRALIEAHVLSCTACQARIDALSDAEGALREQTPEPDGAYYGRLTDAVMARVAKEAAGARPLPERAADAPSTARRRRNYEDAPRGRAPGLPWPAILSTVSAAAAVVVVAVLLFQRQDAWRDGGSSLLTKSSERNEAVPEQEKGAPIATKEEGPAPASENAEPLAKADESAAPAPLALRQGGAAPPSAGADALGAARDDRAEEAPEGRRRAEVRTQSAEEALPGAAAGRMAREKKADDVVAGSSPPSTAATIIVGDAGEKDVAPKSSIPGPTYAEIAGRHALPQLFDPIRASQAALLRAESEFRRLYQEGGAGEDSARVRIYLAEAARARAGDDLDGETFDAIIHHYRRAIRLARDAATARVARQRLDDFVSRSAPRD